MNDLEEKLKQLKIEDFIWLIYIFIIFLSWYSNGLEKKYFVFKDNNAKEKYQTIMKFIFLILIFVYLYFFNDSFSDYINLKNTDSEKKKRLVTLSMIASFLILISGFIFLYIAYEDNDLSVELAFN